MSGLGVFGESWALGMLRRSGYRVVERNVRYRCGEIDIVAWHGDTLAFVEVKTRRSSAFGSPFEAVTLTKYRHLSNAIAHYLAERELQPETYRLDVLAIEVGPSGAVTGHTLLQGVEPPA